jgi:hypothetical protein
MKELLERVEVPEAAEAEERGWRVVAAAYEPGVAGGGSRVAGFVARPRLVAVIAAALFALIVVALTPPGGAVAQWVKERFVAESPPPRLPAKPALTRLPGGGRLLVRSSAGAWVVHADGSRRRLGSFDDATWSPHGLFVGVVRGNEVSAVTPGGSVRWVVERPTAVSAPRWAPSGFRVAYREGTSVRVVAGDGTGDRLLARGAGRATPAWRPGSAANVLAYVDGRARVTVVDVDTRRVLWRRAADGPARQLVWSADGRRLLVLRARFWRVRDGLSGRLVAAHGVESRTTAQSAAYAPTGHRFAVVLQRNGSTDVVLGNGALLFRGAGRFQDVAWSPGGRWIAVGWPSADQWLFLRPTASRAPVAIDHVARRFGPATRIDGWAP